MSLDSLKAAQKAVAPEVSVVIPVRNASDTLPDLLRSLVAQQDAPSFEVIVVDNKSQDNSIHLARGFDQRLSMRFVTAPAKLGGSYARNVGAAAARSMKLLFIDADDTVDSGYLHTMSKSLNEASFVASRVDIKSLNPDWTLQAYGYWQQDGFDRWFDFLPCAGSNCGMTRELFERLGGWPERFLAGEDAALSWSVQLQGTPLTFVRDTVYFYRHKVSILEILKQSRRWGTYSPLLYKQFREHGMPKRTLKAGIREWASILGYLVSVRSKPDVARFASRLGHAIGRVVGSLKHRVFYL